MSAGDFPAYLWEGSPPGDKYDEDSVKVVLKGYRIRRALASARTLCPFPEYSPLFQNTILIISEDLDGYCSVSEGPDDYHMISGCRDKYRIPI
jgi:hypothetical protein